MEEAPGRNQIFQSLFCWVCSCTLQSHWFHYLLSSLLDQHHKTSFFPQPSCLLILSARQQQCKSPTLLFEVSLGEDTPHHSQKHEDYSNTCTMVRTDGGTILPKMVVALTFPPCDQEQLLRALSLHAAGRVRSHTFINNTGEKVLCCYKCKLQNGLRKIYLQ